MIQGQVGLRCLSLALDRGLKTEYHPIPLPLPFELETRVVCPHWLPPSSLLKALVRSGACQMISLYLEALWGYDKSCRGPIMTSEQLLPPYFPAPFLPSSCHGCLTLEGLVAIDQLAGVRNYTRCIYNLTVPVE